MSKNKKSSLKKTKKIISKATSGLANHFIEAALLILSSLPYLLSERSLGRAMENIGIILDGYDPEKLRKNFFNLRSRGYLNRDFQITKQGWEKIKSLTPIYNKPKHWDGNWYLVVFDIPERQERKRKILREKLKDLGFGMLQKSIWLSPYNYLGVVNKLVDYYHINDYVLTTTTSNIDNQDDSVLAQKVWPLKKTNKLYQEFIQKYRKAKKSDISGKFLYLSILKQDPQLPKGLLPDGWRGGETARIARRLGWI